VTRLTEAECLELLAQTAVGRVAVSIDALPAIRTVRFGLIPGHVVFSVAASSQLRRAASNAVVAFQADHVDETARRGWCVVVQGLSEVITSEEDLAQVRSLPITPWRPGPNDDIPIKISLSRVSGEKVSW